MFDLDERDHVWGKNKLLCSVEICFEKSGMSCENEKNKINST